MSLLFALLFTACGPKAPPKVAEVPAVTAPAAAPVVETAVPEPEPEPVKPESNTSFKVKLTSADGTVKEGKVYRIERGDFNGMKTWKDKAHHIKVEIEAGSTAREVPWTELQSVTIKTLKIPKDVDCTYESDFSPWLYVCAVKSISKATTKDGKKWTIESKHRWRLYFEGEDEPVNLWLRKPRALQQDSEVVSLTSGSGENQKMYSQLQQRLREQSTSSMIVKIEIQ